MWDEFQIVLGMMLAGAGLGLAVTSVVAIGSTAMQNRRERTLLAEADKAEHEGRLLDDEVGHGN